MLTLSYSSTYGRAAKQSIESLFAYRTQQNVPELCTFFKGILTIDVTFTHTIHSIRAFHSEKIIMCMHTARCYVCFFPFCRAVCASALNFFRKVHFMYSFASSVSICSIARARIERNRETQPPNQLQHFQMNVANFSLVGFFHTVNCYLDF